RIGVSARLAKTALAEWSGMELNSIEEIWHGLAPPYPELFAWLEGSAPPPDIAELPTFCPLMLAQPLEEGDLGTLDPKDYLAEWKWDGIRVQLVSRGGKKRLYSRSGDDIGGALPDILAALPDDVTLDGELLVMRRGALTIDTVLMYAQRGNGKRSSFYSDYTFGAWAGDKLVPVGKAYSGFTDEELRRLDKWVRDNTVNRYGPVREVAPGLVLEIAF